MSSNAWLNGLAKTTYPIGEKMHALYLHFKTSYSYPKYNGKSGYNLEVHISNHKKDFMVMNALLNKIQNFNLEKFLVLNKIGGLSELSQLNSNEAFDNYNFLIESLSSKEKLYENLENYVRTCFGLHLPDVRTGGHSNDYICSYSDFVLDRIAGYRSPNTSLARIQDALATSYLLSAFPVLQEELKNSIINTLLLKEIEKVKEFTDWWCLT